MNEVPTPGMRIGDADRETALTALGEHMSAGRIDLDEYGDRSAKVTAAKTRGELDELFADLPEPRPVFGIPPKSTAVEPPKPRGELTYTDRPLSQRIAAGMLPLFFVAGFVLFFTVGGWWWFAMPFVFGAIGQGLWGKDWDKDARNRRQDRDRRRGDCNGRRS